MLAKLFWFFVLIITLYFLLVFKAPNIALNIENTIGIKGFSQIATDFKEKYDDTVTNIPTEREVQDTYDVVYSGAIDFKEKFIEGANVTKGKIDTVREKLTGAKETYGEIKEGYDEAKDFIDTNSGKLKVLKDAIDDVSKVSKAINEIGITNTGTNTSTGLTNSGTITSTGVTNTGTIN